MDDFQQKIRLIEMKAVVRFTFDCDAQSHFGQTVVRANIAVPEALQFLPHCAGKIFRLIADSKKFTHGHFPFPA